MPLVRIFVETGSRLLTAPRQRATSFLSHKAHRRWDLSARHVGFSLESKPGLEIGEGAAVYVRGDERGLPVNR